MNIYPASNAEAQMTHAAWDAAEAMDYDALEEFEVSERLKQEEEEQEDEDEDGE